MWAETDASRSQNELNVGDRVASAVRPRRAAPARGGGPARRGVSGRHIGLELCRSESPKGDCCS
jgi:hypothetical protein